MRGYLSWLLGQAIMRGEHTLASGNKSMYFVDCARALSSAEAVRTVGHVVLELLQPELMVVGGPSTGADVLSLAACAVAPPSRPLRWFRVKAGHVEGGAAWGDHVALVEDVVTTGETALHALHAVQRAGLVVDQVIVLVDRLEGGLDKLKAEVPNTQAVFPINDLM